MASRLMQSCVLFGVSLLTFSSAFAGECFVKEVILSKDGLISKIVLDPPFNVFQIKSNLTSAEESVATHSTCKSLVNKYMTAIWEEMKKSRNIVAKAERRTLPNGLYMTVTTSSVAAPTANLPTNEKGASVSARGTLNGGSSSSPGYWPNPSSGSQKSSGTVYWPN